MPGHDSEHDQLFGVLFFFFSRGGTRDARCFHIALFLSFRLFELTSNISQCVFSVMPAMWMAYANTAIGLAGYHCVCGDE